MGVERRFFDWFKDQEHSLEVQVRQTTSNRLVIMPLRLFPKFPKAFLAVRLIFVATTDVFH